MHDNFISQAFSSRPPYGAPLLEINSGGNNVFVISDLHLASGINTNGNYEGTENFFADQSFVRFIDHLDKKNSAPRALLVINGDFIDFLRICDYPVTSGDFAEWEEMLAVLGIHRPQTTLRDSIIKKERTFGLRTNDYKSVWKLHKCILGHKALFERLALWLYDGNQLIITKGNHDLEWYWIPVQNYLQYFLAKLLAEKLHLPLENTLPSVTARVTFADHSVIIDKRIYIEHGHCYENMTAVQGSVLADNKQELNLPFGSFFNRYLINKIELVYPFIDNVRPRQNILLVLFRERFPLALKMVFYYVPFAILLVPKRMWWPIFKYAATFFLIIILPLAITAFAIYQSLPSGMPPKKDMPWLLQQVLNTGKNLGFLFLSYLFGRIMTFVQLSPPHSFIQYAENVFHNHKEVELVTFGHTHNPEQKKTNGKWYLNTGTWMPVFEASSAEIRIDKTYTFLQLDYDSTGKLITHPLQRWNDDASREDSLTLMEDN